MNRIFLFFILLTNLLNGVLAQPFPELLKDPKAFQIAKAATEAMYNMEKRKCDSLVQLLRPKYSQHPAYFMIQAMNIRWNIKPLAVNSDAYNDHRRLLELCFEKAQLMLKENPESNEGIFFSLSTQSLMAQYAAEDGNYLKALRIAKSVYGHMKKGFELTEVNPEFYFSTGLYNFYREQYPETHPIYKSFVWVFASGNKQLGLEQLETAVKKGTFTNVEAALFLSYIYLRYEHKPEKSIEFSQHLISKFPKNFFFQVLYTDALILNKRYEEAKTYASKLKEIDHPYYQTAYHAFQGVIAEKHSKNDNLAFYHYNKALEGGEEYQKAIENLKSIAYAGQARITDRKGFVAKAKSLYEKALESSPYAYIKTEAELYLKKH